MIAINLVPRHHVGEVGSDYNSLIGLNDFWLLRWRSTINAESKQASTSGVPECQSDARSKSCGRRAVEGAVRELSRPSVRAAGTTSRRRAHDVTTPL